MADTTLYLIWDTRTFVHIPHSEEVLIQKKSHVREKGVLAQPLSAAAERTSTVSDQKYILSQSLTR